MDKDRDVRLTGDEVPDHELRELTAEVQPVVGGGRGRRDRASTVVAVLAVVVAVAIVKPWGGAAPAPVEPVAVPHSQAAVHQASPAASAPPEVAVTDPNAMSCLTHQTEQVITLERWPDREIKSWSLAVGAGTALPDLQTLPVRMASSRIVGIGVCPGTGPDSSDGATGGGPPGATPGAPPVATPGSLTWTGATILDVQALAGPTRTDLGAPPRITGQFDYVAAGVLYGAPGSSISASPAASEPAGVGALQSWPAGRYALGYTFPGDPTHAERWVVVEIRTPAYVD